MALTEGQKRAMATLQERKKGGTIKDEGLQRLENLRKLQRGEGTQEGPVSAMRKMRIDKPKSVINAQTEANQQAADATFQMQNPSSQTNPYGYQNVTRDENGNVVVESGFAPGQQQLFDYQQAYLQGQFGNLAGGTGGFGDATSERQRIEDQLYGSYTRGYDEQQAKDRQALDQSLAERGIGIGSGEAYNNAVSTFEKTWGDRRDEARRQATAGGGEEWQRSAMLPLQQAQGLFALGSPQMGNFAGYQGGQVNPTDIGGIASTYRGQNIQKQMSAADRAAQLQIANMNRPPAAAAPNLSPPIPPPNI